MNKKGISFIILILFSVAIVLIPFVVWSEIDSDPKESINHLSFNEETNLNEPTSDWTIVHFNNNGSKNGRGLKELIENRLENWQIEKMKIFTNGDYSSNSIIVVYPLKEY